MLLSELQKIQFFFFSGKKIFFYMHKLSQKTYPGQRFFINKLFNYHIRVDTFSETSNIININIY